MSGEPRFTKTYCSQCGGEFGPGDHGYSHCQNHQIMNEQFMVTVGMDAMRICLGLSPIHHDPDAIGRFISARAEANE